MAASPRKKAATKQLRVFTGYPLHRTPRPPPPPPPPPPEYGDAFPAARRSSRMSIVTQAMASYHMAGQLPDAKVPVSFQSPRRRSRDLSAAPGSVDLSTASPLKPAASLRRELEHMAARAPWREPEEEEATTFAKVEAAMASLVEAANHHKKPADWVAATLERALHATSAAHHDAHGDDDRFGHYGGVDRQRQRLLEQSRGSFARAQAAAEAIRIASAAAHGIGVSPHVSPTSFPTSTAQAGAAQAFARSAVCASPALEKPTGHPFAADVDIILPLTPSHYASIKPASSKAMHEPGTALGEAPVWQRLRTSDATQGAAFHSLLSTTFGSTSTVDDPEAPPEPPAEMDLEVDDGTDCRLRALECAAQVYGQPRFSDLSPSPHRRPPKRPSSAEARTEEVPFNYELEMLLHSSLSIRDAPTDEHDAADLGVDSMKAPYVSRQSLLIALNTALRLAAESSEPMAIKAHTAIKKQWQGRTDELEELSKLDEKLEDAPSAADAIPPPPDASHGQLAAGTAASSSTKPVLVGLTSEGWLPDRGQPAISERRNHPSPGQALADGVAARQAQHRDGEPLDANVARFVEWHEGVVEGMGDGMLCLGMKGEMKLHSVAAKMLYPHIYGKSLFQGDETMPGVRAARIVPLWARLPSRLFSPRSPFPPSV
jgi:hypothetical protein